VKNFFYKKPDVTIFLFGGFGNNISQIYFGKYLERKKFKVHYSDLLTNENFLTKFLGWSIHDQTHHNLDLQYKKFSFIQTSLILINLIICKLINTSFYNVYFEGKNLLDDIDENNLSKYKFFFGYFQSSKLLRNDLISSFLIEDNYETFNQISVHIRGGDFIESHRLSENYYFKTLKLANKFELPIKVFTNDRNYSTKILNKVNIPFSFSDGSSYDDFVEILKSKIIISGNSTFSTWAALISRAEVIYLPKKSGYANILTRRYDLDTINKNIKYIEDI
tara:strand:+ start:9583 stop:10416 length:834 start_codon:yes stop_codon:yes gene_type:complete